MMVKQRCSLTIPVFRLSKITHRGAITTTTQPNRNTPTIWDWIGNTDTDWYDVVFGGTAFSQEHSLSVSGGTEKIQYYFSSNYMGQEGMMAIRRDNYSVIR